MDIIATATAWRSIAKRLFFLAFLGAFTMRSHATDESSTRIVWWGNNNFWNNYSASDHFRHTNGLAESGGEFITNAVSVAAGTGIGVALKPNGTVSGFGLHWPSLTDMPTNLTNVASISMDEDACWAIKRDGTVVRWSHMGGSCIRYRQYHPQPDQCCFHHTSRFPALSGFKQRRNGPGL